MSFCVTREVGTLYIIIIVMLCSFYIFENVQSGNCVIAKDGLSSVSNHPLLTR